MSQISKSYQNLIINGSLITVTAACTTALWSGDSLLPDSLLVGFGIAAVGGIILRLPWRRRPRSRWTQLASMVRTQSLNPDMQSWEIKWKPVHRIPDEFVFRGLGLDVPIPESRMLRFLTIARRRQTNALYGGRGLGLRRTIQTNWVLSKKHFTKLTRPQFGVDEFYSILLILGYTRLLMPRKQGTSGRLVGDYGTDRYLDIAKNRWLELLPPPPPRRSLSNLWGRLPN